VGTIADRTRAKMAARLAEMTGLAPGSRELQALLKLSIEVVERVVWEVVPVLAGELIRERLAELAKSRTAS
jgi:hypothetical protein